MNPGVQYIQEQAAKAAAQRLKLAATFVASHVKNPLFHGRMGKGANAVLVRFEWPGVLAVYDPATGAPLALSMPGKPGTLRKDFARKHLGVKRPAAIKPPKAAPLTKGLGVGADAFWQTPAL